LQTHSNKKTQSFIPIKSVSSFFVVIIRVFKPGSVVNPVQGPSSGLWPGYQVVRVNSDFFKNKNDIILVKKKKKSQRVATGFLTGSVGSAESPQVLTSSIFFKLDPVPAPGQPGLKSTHQVRPDFKIMVLIPMYSFFFIVLIPMYYNCYSFFTC
jgi:hypothetical protein